MTPSNGWPPTRPRISSGGSRRKGDWFLGRDDPGVGLAALDSLDLRATDGLQLTQAGYLRPADLRKVVERLEIASAARATREADAPEVFYLREGLKRLGLIRKLKGRTRRTVAGTKLAGDPVAPWEHLRLRLPAVGLHELWRPTEHGQVFLRAALRAQATGPCRSADKVGTSVPFS